jgi:hypothetical protein
MSHHVKEESKDNVDLYLLNLKYAKAMQKYIK